MADEKDKKVLICGDSFASPDADYPGLHWSEKLLNSTAPTFELYNMSHGGDSNALIALQLMQGMEFHPDFVILSFTAMHRHELDKNQNACAYDQSLESINSSRIARYKSTSQSLEIPTAHIEIIDKFNTEVISKDFEILKNYFIISYCINLMQTHSIEFCYSLGGFVNHTNPFSVIQSNYIKNNFFETTDKMLKINLWEHKPWKKRPYFHVDDDAVQTAFANECIHHLNKAGIT